MAGPSLLGKFLFDQVIYRLPEKFTSFRNRKDSVSHDVLAQ